VISLAAALALPLTTAAGEPLPGRDLILFLTFSVILATLVLQGLSLPFLIRALGLEDDGSVEREETRARIVSADAALARLEARRTGPKERRPRLRHAGGGWRVRHSLGTGGELRQATAGLCRGIARPTALNIQSVEIRLKAKVEERCQGCGLTGSKRYDFLAKEVSGYSHKTATMASRMDSYRSWCFPHQDTQRRFGVAVGHQRKGKGFLHSKPQEPTGASGEYRQSTF
jgi:hypothetical protein